MPGLRRWDVVSAAFRSGLRRCPRALISSLGRQPAPAAEPTSRSFERIEEHALAAAWLGHATVLARFDGTNVLVDPVFSERIGLRVGRRTMGPRRLAQAPTTPERLPKIDLVLITHAHFDHLDKPTLRRLAYGGTTVVSPRGTRRLIPRGFRRVVELGAGESEVIDGVRIAAIRSLHWGARGLINWSRGHNSYLVESARGSILFAGDTALTSAFADVGPVDLAVFCISSYNPWERMHATPEQVWSMFCGTGAKELLPVHHSTFKLGAEPVDEPMRRLLAAADGHAERIIQVIPGGLWVGPTSAGTAPRDAMDTGA
jgi:L-ascorbate metabolism protein UlaG (beta-lactamase superfamily)